MHFLHHFVVLAGSFPKNLSVWQGQYLLDNFEGFPCTKPQNQRQAGQALSVLKSPQTTRNRHKAPFQPEPPSQTKTGWYCLRFPFGLAAKAKTHAQHLDVPGVWAREAREDREGLGHTNIEPQASTTRDMQFYLENGLLKVNALEMALFLISCAN